MLMSDFANERIVVLVYPGHSPERVMDTSCRTAYRWLAYVKANVELEITRERWCLRGDGPLGVLAVLVMLYLLLSTAWSL